MGTTAEKLVYLNQTKVDIKAAIEAKGVTVSDVPFRDYASKISQIVAGDTTAPTITTAKVEDANPDKLVVVFSEVVTITDVTGLTITGDATPTLSAPTGSGTNTITFTLSTALTNGQSVTLNVASSNTIEDAAGNYVAATTMAITNNVAVPVSSYEAETTSYINRVEVDGGIIINPDYVNSAILLLKSKGIFTTDFSWLSASFGLKMDANYNVSKLYSIKGSQWDLIGQEILSATWKASGAKTSQPVITIDKVRAVAFKPVTKINLPQPNTIFSLHSTNYITSNQYVYDGFDSAGRNLLLRNADNYVSGAGTYPSSVIRVDPDTHIIQSNFQGATSSLYIDEITVLNQVNFGTLPLNYITLGNAISPTTGFSMGGDWSELLVLGTGISTSDVEIREFLNEKYNTYIV